MNEPRNYGQFDAVVVGGGPVGAAAALELSAAGFNLLLLESRGAKARSADVRPLALSYGSRLILERLDVWAALAPATPIERIHVSHRGRFGRTVLSAADARLPALGYVADYASLVAALERALEQARVPVQFGASVTFIAHDNVSARVEFETAEGLGECFAALVVVADGRAAATGLDMRAVDYGQSAVSAHVESDQPHCNVAYERFTPEGPLALLPYGGGYGVVWTTAPDRAQDLLRMSEAAFLSALQERFGERAGRFVRVGARAEHPVHLRVAERTTAGRAVLVGNAAQVLHPVAGQGFNLGLRDAWELATEVRRRGLRDPSLFDAYRARRRLDRSGGVAFTHGVVTLFSNDWWPVAAARGAGLTLLDCVPLVKDFVVRRMIFGGRG